MMSNRIVFLGVMPYRGSTQMNTVEQHRLSDGRGHHPQLQGIFDIDSGHGTTETSQEVRSQSDY
uniref:Uncharacterized protein n=1 Tax=Arundo donax TaxID=35708 RepID=A0A0A9DM35_ARUDO